MGQLKKLDISKVRENEVALRTVNRQGESYLGLVDSIRALGFMGTITVREQKDPATNEAFYELVDGLHRLSAAKDAGITVINADVISLTDDQVLEAQLMANIHKIETKPIEYSRQLLRILARNPLMSEAELGAKLGKSSSWIQARLGLNKIDNPSIITLVDEGKIGLANAYAMAKLPSAEMADFVDRAMTQAPDEFVPAVNERVKEIKDSKRKGADAPPQEFQPVAYMQKMSAIKDEMNSPEIGVLITRDCATPLDGYKMAIAWCLHLDPDSIKVQKDKDDARKAARDAAKAKRAKEMADKKAEKERIAAEAGAEANQMMDEAAAIA